MTRQLNKIKRLVFDFIQLLLCSIIGALIGIQFYEGLDPDWVSALAAIAAVGVAIYIPWKIHSNELKRRQDQDDLKRRMNASVLANEAMEIVRDIEGVVGNFEVVSKAKDPNKLEYLSPAIMIGVPVDLSVASERLSFFDSQKATDTIKALVLVELYQRTLLDKIRIAKINSVPIDAAEFFEGMKPALLVAKELLSSVIPYFEKLAGYGEPLSPAIDSLVESLTKK